MTFRKLVPEEQESVEFPSTLEIFIHENAFDNIVR